MHWLALTILSAFSGSLSRILQKVLLTNKDSDPFAFSFVFQMIVALLFLVYTLVTNSFELPNLSDVWLNLLVMTSFYSLGNLFTFKAFQVAEASEVSVIFASNTVWSVIAALVLLGERLTAQNIVGIILVVGGVVAINVSKTTWQLSRGHLFALLGAMLFGIAFTNDAYIIGRYESVASYMVIAFALPAIATLVMRPRSTPMIVEYLSQTTLKKMLLCTIFYAVSAMAIFTAYKLGGPASIISPIQQTSIIFTVLLSYFFLNEKDKLVNKVIGTALTFVGVLMLV